MNHTEIINKLVGHIHPVGETNEDAKRYQNLLDHIKLVDELIMQLVEVSECEKRHEASIKRSGIEANKFIKSTFEYLSQFIQLTENQQ